jgi:molecular chaperone HtpG
MPSSRRGVRLHVRRVFIMEDTGQLMPTYLRLVRGTIDSADLPLNVSRELLQGSRAVEHIRSSATKRVLKLLSRLADEKPSRYATVWKEFGAVLKEDVADDYANRDDIARLLRFTSTRSGSAEPDLSLSDCGPDAGGPGQDLLPARPGPGRRREQSAPGSVRQQGHRGPAPAPRGGQLGGE